MAFNPERLSLLVEPVGGVGVRIFSYKTDDTEATVIGAGYAPGVADYGLRTADIMIVTPETHPGADPYIMSVDSVDADGNATFNIARKKFSLDMAGAPADGTGDSADAFDAVFDLIRADIAANGKSNTRYIIDLAGGIYRTTRSLDFTNFTGWNVGIVNGMIIGACAGKPVIDASGGRGYFHNNLFIYGDPTDRPSHGIICPRATVNQFSGSQEFGRLSIDGYFTDAAFYAYGMEGALLRHCMIWNRDFSGRVAVFEGYDEHPVTSDYATPLTGATSMIWNKVLMSNFRHLPTTGTDPTIHTSALATAVTQANPGVVTCAAGHPFQNGDEVVFFLPNQAGMAELKQLPITVANATATTFELSGVDTTAYTAFSGSCLVVKKADVAPVYLARVQGFDFDTSYIVSWGQPHIELAFPDSSWRKMSYVTLDLLYEGAGIPNNILINTDGAACDLRGLTVKNYNLNALTSFISISGGGSVVMRNPTIHAYDAVETVDLFDLPASVTVAGADIHYKTLALTKYVDCASFSGTVLDATTTVAYSINRRTAHKSDGTSTSFTVTPGSGAFTTLGSMTMTWRIDGEYVDIDLSIAITTNGTAAGYVAVALPVNAATDLDSVLTGRAVGGGNQLQAYLASINEMRIANYNNSYPGADGYTLVVSGRYRRAV